MYNLLDNLQPKEQEKFKRISRRLLSETFIVKAKDDVSKMDYLFIKSHQDLFNETLDILGYEVQLDKSLEIAALTISPQGNEIGFANRTQFSYKQTFFIILLWQFYYKTRQKTNEHVIMTYEDLYNELKIADLKNITKTDIKNTILKLKSHNIVNNTNLPDITLPNGQLYIYPSIMFVINEQECNRIYQELKDNNLPAKNTENEENEENEEKYNEELETVA